VFRGDLQYAFHLIPSGVIHPGVTGILGHGMVINIQALIREIDDLKNHGT
jgi:adenylosuccinate synthase